MGSFSWKTQDTNRSITYNASNCPTFSVIMVDDKGNKWVEENYEGYGIFGGKDFYELTAEMNDCASDREVGIDLFFSPDKCLTPNLYEFRSKWENSSPEHCDGDEDDQLQKNRSMFKVYVI